jgi:catechol 2,3-dioxygenase-like lactoylglutathione lyase family enzyme
MEHSALGFDHLVLVVRDVEASLTWYERHLGLTGVRVEAWRRGEVPFPSLRVDEGTIIDFVGGEHRERGHLDHVCFVVTVEHLVAVKASLEVLDEGERFGARGVAHSIYVHDPDGLVVELRAYPDAATTASTSSP